MGIPRRDGGGGSFQVNIRPLVKTCADEQGFAELMLPSGVRIVTTGLQLWPHHDRGFHEAFTKFLANQHPKVTGKPVVTVLLGNVLNEEAFKQVADSQDRMRRMIAANHVPLVKAIMKEHEGYEDRFLALAKAGGEFIAEFAKISGGHVFYIPAPQASGQLPNEMGLFDFVLTQKEKLDAKAERHPDEAVEGPPIPLDFAEFIGLKGRKNVTVMPFGSALRLNDELTFIAADYKRRQPASASQVDVEQTAESTVRLGDGKVSSAYWTTPKHSLGGPHRRWWQAHEVGNAFDLKQLGFLRNYDRRAKGFWTGTTVGNKIQGASVSFLCGTDKRRSFVVDGVPYDEETPFLSTRKISLAGLDMSFLKVDTAKAQEPAKEKPKASPKPALSVRSKRSGARGKKKK